MASHSPETEGGLESSDTESEEENSGLDLVFAMDCTGSMGSYIEQAQKNIRNIVEGITSSQEDIDIRLALVEYRDHPPQDSTFVTRVHEFTSRVDEMKSWLDACGADGGGDEPEAVADALNQVFRLDWRPDSIKICVFIADAPPHGLGLSGGDGFPNGCPNNIDPMRTTRHLAEIGVMIYMVGCEPSINASKDFFKGLSYLTGGQYVPLTDAELLTHVIIGGAQEEISLDQFTEDVNKAVKSELESKGINVDEMSLAHDVYETLKKKGAKVWQLQRNNTCLVTVDDKVKKLSNCGDLEEVRDMLGTGNRRYGGRGRGRGRGGRRGRGRGRGRGGGRGEGWDRSRSSDEEIEDEGKKTDPGMLEAYAATETEINFSQVERMVQKSLMQNRALLGIK